MGKYKYAIFVKYPDGWRMEAYVESSNKDRSFVSIYGMKNDMKEEHPDRRVLICRIIGEQGVDY